MTLGDFYILLEEACIEFLEAEGETFVVLKMSLDTTLDVMLDNKTGNVKYFHLSECELTYYSSESSALIRKLKRMIA